MGNGHRARSGFTLIEVVLAIVILTGGMLALAAGAAATVRSMADASRIVDAARAAENERERAYSIACMARSGVDSVQGARVAWSTVPGATILAITESIALPHATVVDISAAGACR